MTANIRSAAIAAEVANTLGTAPDADEIQEALVTAARLGKIAGLRRARKHYRNYAPWKIAESIRNTYQALGADTAAYEQEQADKRQAKLDAALGTIGYEAGAAVIEAESSAGADAFDTVFSADAVAGFAGMEPFTVPTVKTVYDAETLTVDADAPRPVKDSPQA